MQPEMRNERISLIFVCTDSLAQLVEHNTFNVGVVGSSPTRITKGSSPKQGGDSFFMSIPVYQSATYVSQLSVFECFDTGPFADLVLPHSLAV